MELTDTYTYNIFKVLKYNDFLSSAPHKTYLGLTLSGTQSQLHERCAHYLGLCNLQRMVGIINIEDLLVYPTTEST